MELDCKGECVQGYRYEKNTVSLLAFLVPGEYRLALFYKQMTRVESEWLTAQLVNLPYSFHLNMQPLFETEDRHNCRAARLPHSLNIPGLLDAESYLNYRERVMLDLQGVSQTVAFTLAEEAVVRVVTTAPDGIDVDLTLTAADDSQVTRSTAVSGAEGLVVELPTGAYKLKLNYGNSLVKSPQKLFCVTYLLEIGIRPVSSVHLFTDFYNLDLCEDSTAAIDASFAPMEDRLKASKMGSFVLSPTKTFRLPVDPTAGDAVVYSYEFELTRPVYLNFGKS
jgi:hypothetical protein